jgi:hypothetical protein
MRKITCKRKECKGKFGKTTTGLLLVNNVMNAENIVITSQNSAVFRP